MDNIEDIRAGFDKIIPDHNLTDEQLRKLASNEKFAKGFSKGMQKASQSRNKTNTKIERMKYTDKHRARMAKPLANLADMATNEPERTISKEFAKVILKSLEDGKITPEKARKNINRLNKSVARRTQWLSGRYKSAIRKVLSSYSTVVKGLASAGALAGTGAAGAGTAYALDKKKDKNKKSKSGTLTRTGAVL